MLLVIFVVLSIVGIVVGALLPEREDDFDIGCILFGVFMLFISIIFGAMATANYINIDAKFSAKQNKYESLIYQLEISKEDDSVDKYFLYNEIDNWNSELIKKKGLYKNLWIGFLYPDKLYEDFEVIEYK
jgi:hypothetical protein